MKNLIGAHKRVLKVLFFIFFIVIYEKNITSIQNHSIHTILKKHTEREFGVKILYMEV